MVVSSCNLRTVLSFLIASDSGNVSLKRLGLNPLKDMIFQTDHTPRLLWHTCQPKEGTLWQEPRFSWSRAVEFLSPEGTAKACTADWNCHQISFNITLNPPSTSASQTPGPTLAGQLTPCWFSWALYLIRWHVLISACLADCYYNGNFFFPL